MFERFGLVEYCRHTKVDAFVEGLERGVLLASRCTDCGHTSFPPRADCEHCHREGIEWQPISGRGAVTSHTTIHAAPTGFEGRAPYQLAVVELAAGGRALALVRSGSQALKIGDAVEVCPETFDTEDGPRFGYVAKLISESGKRE